MRAIDRAAVLAEAPHRPYARFATATLTGIRGYAAGGALLWWGEAPWGPVGHGLGPPDELAELLRAAPRDAVGWFNLPRGTAPPPGYVVREDWDLRWTTVAPAVQPGQERVVRLADPAPVATLLDLALPGSSVRPDSPHARAWYGIWAGPLLVACAADRSPGPLPAGDPTALGVIAAVAVHPAHRGRGLGAAVSAAATARLLRSYDLVALGVTVGNTAASALYERLGYTASYEITSVQPGPR